MQFTYLNTIGLVYDLLILNKIVAINKKTTVQDAVIIKPIATSQ